MRLEKKSIDLRDGLFAWKSLNDELAVIPYEAQMRLIVEEFEPHHVRITIVILRP